MDLGECNARASRSCCAALTGDSRTSADARAHMFIGVKLFSWLCKIRPSAFLPAWEIMFAIGPAIRLPFSIC